MIIERDVTDLGLAPVDERSPAERAEAARRARVEAMADPGPPAPEELATARQRGRAMNQARRECRWSRPSASRHLLRDCPGCGAPAGGWCRRFGQAVLGRLCSVRPEG